MENADCPSFSKRVLDALRSAGWTPERDQVEMVDAYRGVFGSSWVSAAAPFVRRFGGLSIMHLLWIRPIGELAIPEAVRRVSAKVGAKVGAKACAVAASNYMGDGCSIWCDEGGHFYAVDSEGVEFVGTDFATVFEVLLFGFPTPTPPAKVGKALNTGVQNNRT